MIQKKQPSPCGEGCSYVDDPYKTSGNFPVGKLFLAAFNMFHYLHHCGAKVGNYLKC